MISAMTIKFLFVDLLCAAIYIYILMGYLWDTYVVTCFLPSTIRILALLYVLSTVLRISSSNLLYTYIYIYISSFKVTLNNVANLLSFFEFPVW